MMKLSRRTILKGLGASLALPWLESMGPLSAWVDTVAPNGTRTPNRMAFVYVPNGVNMALWTPTGDSNDFTLSRTLEPLQDHKDKLIVFSGLTVDKARPHGDGGGDHARAMSAFLTGCQPRKTDGADIRAGISADQIAAARLSDQTRLPSLEIGCEAGALAGNCDSGYSCAYNSTVSWRSPTTPVPKLVNPRLVFERLYSSGNAADRARRDARRRSILDAVHEDVAGLQPRLSGSDRRKLEEYLTAIRDVEQRIERATRLPEPARPDMTVPQEAPRVYEEHIHILCDLLVLAFQADITRVATFVFANEGSNRAYSFIGVSEGHHDLSHHGNDPRKLEKIGQINRFHITQYAYLISRLRSVQEGDGTLLDHCMVAYGSGNGDGNRHNHDDVPVIMTGGASGSLRTNRHLRYPRETPVTNLWLAMLDRMRAPVETLGDSTGRLTNL